MSADNGIYVLVTKRTRTIENGIIVNDGNKHKVYRVAHAQAIGNFDWYKKYQPYNLGAYMNDVWGESPTFKSEKEALEEASKKEKEFEYIEYGIVTIDASDMVFYGDC